MSWLWPGSQGPEIELYLPGMTPGVDAPILTPGGVVPLGSTLRLSAPGKTIQYFSVFDIAEFTPDPKDTIVGRIQATGSAEIAVDDPFAFAHTIKARLHDPATGYSGLTEITVTLE